MTYDSWSECSLVPEAEAEPEPEATGICQVGDIDVWELESLSRIKYRISLFCRLISLINRTNNGSSTSAHLYKHDTPTSDNSVLDVEGVEEPPPPSLHELMRGRLPEWHIHSTNRPLSLTASPQILSRWIEGSIFSNSRWRIQRETRSPMSLRWEWCLSLTKMSLRHCRRHWHHLTAWRVQIWCSSTC